MMQKALVDHHHHDVHARQREKSIKRRGEGVFKKAIGAQTTAASGGEEESGMRAEKLGLFQMTLSS